MRTFLLALLCCFAITGIRAAAVATVDLGTTDVENGLVNTQTGHPSDGEVEVVTCGPAGGERDSKKNWAGEDPTLDVPPDTWPDGFFYFNVTDPIVKSEERLILAVTVFDDPALQPNTFLALNYTNNLSTGPADVPNTFFGHPIQHVLAGTNAWVTVSWELADAGFKTYMQSTSDVRVWISNNQRVCFDTASVTVNPSTLPVDLVCTKAGRTTVNLAWKNLGTYDSLVAKRDGGVIASLAVDATTLEDSDVPAGIHSYQIVATAGAETGGPSCTVTIFPDMTGQSVSVDLAETDVEDGIQNSHTAPPDGGDGENEPAFCGPAGTERESRRNWGIEDPTPDGLAGETLYPDSLFYFVVTDPDFKGQSEFVLAVTVYADPALPADTGFYLQYTNELSTGPGDIANTFFPLDAPPVRLLGQTDTWVTLEWPVETAGFRSFMQGDSDFRIGVTNGSRVCVDEVSLTVGIPNYPMDLACAVQDQDVTLTWRAFRTYDEIRILRDGVVIAELSQNETTYLDSGVAAGAHTYGVKATYDSVEGGVMCDVTVGGGEPEFVRGDVNDDKSVNIADPISLLGHLFGGAAAPACRDAADGNNDGQLNIADAISILGHLFGGTGPLPAPFPTCGVDGVADALPACEYQHCP